MNDLDTAFDQIISAVGVEDVDDAAVPCASADRIRILVADPDPLARRALTDSLRSDRGFFVIGQASTAIETIELARHYAPALVLLATQIPGADAVAVCERIVDANPATRVVMLANAADLNLEMAAVRAGASGFVIKSDEVESIRRALLVVDAGNAIISPELTDREWEVLDLICNGATTREIADTLYLSPETVNSHAKSVLKKLGVHSRAAAVEAASLLRGDVLV